MGLPHREDVDESKIREAKRLQILKELWDTEKEYVNNLEIAVNVRKIKENSVLTFFSSFI